MTDHTLPALDKNIPIPLYFQLQNWLLEQIKNGTYEVGASIPTEIQLRDMFQVSRTTVRQAIRELILSGWLVRNGTRGTIVSIPKKKSASVRSMEPFNQQIIRAGQTPRTEIMELKLITADQELADYLAVNTGDKIISMFRRRFADEIAVMTIRSYMAYERCRFVLDHDFTKESLYEVLSLKEETKTYGVRQIVEAQLPTAQDKKMFKIDSSKPILSFQCFDRNHKGEIISYNQIRYRGELMKFEVDVTEGTSDRNFHPPEQPAKPSFIEESVEVKD